jgi:predicted O-methyltransferase YrrM
MIFNENWYGDSQLIDLENLFEKVKHIDGEIIEIGCWEGKSTISLANKCYPEILICNDTWLGNVQESIVTGRTHPTEEILKERDVYSIFKSNMDNNTQKNYTIVKEDCIEWLKTYQGKIKFIHIDASHEYESVFETISLVLPKIVKGGIICGDDYESSNMSRDDLHGGVERAVKETLPNHKNIHNLWYYIIE